MKGYLQFMICHHYKCVFIHIPKNAGQSIEHVFLDLLDLDWQTRAPLLLRKNDKPELGPLVLAHLKATDYVRYKYLPQEMFDDYFKFTIVRNPWGRMISIYKYLGYDKRYEFKRFLMGVFKNTIFKKKYWFVGPQTDYVYDKNENQLVDFICRFENLQDDFNYVCQQIGLPPLEVPHVNHSKNNSLVSFDFKPKRFIKYLIFNMNLRTIPSFKQYQDYYDSESRELIAELYSRDIELLNYKFE